ncbi:MAG: hypothetical protein EPO08_19070 [Rhodospirillaceae bacterium]|nr:MAG: hypothetical protein EPO08_19070 [Rhodospirillaceae bacterium]
MKKLFVAGRAPAAAILALGFAVMPHQAWAQDSFGDAFWQFRTSAGVDYSSGNYGATTKTDVIYAYASLRAMKGPWTLKLVVPWISVLGPAVLLDAGSSGSVATGTTRSASGPGDVNLSASYSLERFYNRGLFIDFTARLKIPSASFADGLGTGKADGAVQIDVAQSIGAFMPFVTLGYKANGRPKGYHLRDVVYGTAGVQYNFNDKLATGVLFDYRQAALAAADDPREGTLYLNVKFARSWTVNLYGVAGFSRNSPSAGGGTVITYRW